MENQLYSVSGKLDGGDKKQIETYLTEFLNAKHGKMDENAVSFVLYEPFAVNKKDMLENRADELGLKVRILPIAYSPLPKPKMTHILI